jgi:hypothetical protein
MENNMRKLASGKRIQKSVSLTGSEDHLMVTDIFVWELQNLNLFFLGVYETSLLNLIVFNNHDSCLFGEVSVSFTL